MTRIEQYYKYLLQLKLLYKLNYINISELPNLTQIQLHITFKNTLLKTKKVLPTLLILELISGQKAKLIKAQKANSNFNLYKNKPISCKVTLRNKYMYLFLDKLITLVLPKIKNLKGLYTKNITNNGSFSFGLSTINVFPEIKALTNKYKLNSGIDITLKSNAKSTLETQLLFSSFNFPFKESL